MNIIFKCAALGAILVSTSIFAEQSVKGEIYNVTPKSDKVTLDYCKAHIVDTYTSDMKEAYKHVKGDNGVEAKDLGYKVREEGGVYFLTGKAEMSGTYENKPWKEVVHYYAQSLDKNEAPQYGVWYSKDCKGFFKIT